MSPRVQLSLSISIAALSLVGCEATTIIGAWDPAGDGGGQGGDDGAPLPESFYFEAEEGELSGPFVVERSEAASGGAYLVASESAESSAQPGAGRALYRFTLRAGASYVLWGRIHAPEPERSRYWLRFDGAPFVSWRIATGDAWFWDDVHEDATYGEPLSFSLSAGEHVLELASGDAGAELDRLYLTALGDEPPGNTTPCDPPHSIERGDACVPSCGSHGDTTCGALACDGREALEAFDCDVCCFES